MSGFQMIPEEMKAAFKAAEGAAERAIGHSSSTAMEKAGEALPGSDSFSYLPDLGSKWTKIIGVWAEDTTSFGEEIARVGADHQRTDDNEGVDIGLLGGALGVK